VLAGSDGVPWPAALSRALAHSQRCLGDGGEDRVILQLVPGTATVRFEMNLNALLISKPLSFYSVWC